MTTFNMELCSQGVLKQAEKLATKIEFSGVFIGGNRSEEE